MAATRRKSTNLTTDSLTHVSPLYGQRRVVHRGRVAAAGSPLVVIIAQGRVHKSLEADGKTPRRNMP